MATPKRIIEGELVEFGYKPFQKDPNVEPDPKQPPSFYVNIKDEKGLIQTYHGVMLKDELINKGLIVKNKLVEKDEPLLVSLADYDMQDVHVPDPKDPTKWIPARRRVWEVNLIEKPLDLPNSIEPDTSRELIVAPKSEISLEKRASMTPDEKVEMVANFAKKNKTVLGNGVTLKKIALDDMMGDIPPHIKQSYQVSMKNFSLGDEAMQFRHAKTPDEVAFEMRKNGGLHTKKSDAETIKAMLDIVENKGWKSIKITGTKEFKSQAWLEASLKGIEVRGYKPTEQDLINLKSLQDIENPHRIDQVPTVDNQQTVPVAPLQAPSAFTQVQKSHYENGAIWDTPSREELLNVFEEKLAQLAPKGILEKAGAMLVGRMDFEAFNDKINEYAKQYQGQLENIKFEDLQAFRRETINQPSVVDANSLDQVANTLARMNVENKLMENGTWDKLKAEYLNLGQQIEPPVEKDVTPKPAVAIVENLIEPDVAKSPVAPIVAPQETPNIAMETNLAPPPPSPDYIDADYREIDVGEPPAHWNDIPDTAYIDDYAFGEPSTDFEPYDVGAPVDEPEPVPMPEIAPDVPPVDDTKAQAHTEPAPAPEPLVDDKQTPVHPARQTKEFIGTIQALDTATMGLDEQQRASVLQNFNERVDKAITDNTAIDKDFLKQVAKQTVGEIKGQVDYVKGFLLDKNLDQALKQHLEPTPDNAIQKVDNSIER